MTESEYTVICESCSFEPPEHSQNCGLRRQAKEVLRADIQSVLNFLEGGVEKRKVVEFIKEYLV